jgi:uncharacterized protein (TIGR02266 family)
MHADDDTTGKTGAERRRFQRSDLDYELAVDIHGEHVPYTGIIKDISEGGLFIATVAEHKIGQVLQIRFTFPSLGTPVDVKARVRWYRDEFSAGGASIGVGVQFVDLPDEIAKKINAYLKDKDVQFYEDGM